MKVTRTELQDYFKDSLPSIGELADVFTFHAFEIEEVDADVLDIKVLPNRMADCNTAEGIARELSAILDVPLQDATAPSYDGQPTVAVTAALLSGILGIELSREEVLDVFRRLAFRVEESGETISVTAPAPRTDIVIPEDVAEEIGQILGYERVTPRELPPIAGEIDQDRFRGIERMKDMLVEKGFTEISTQSFATEGDIELANPMDKTRPFLRTTLAKNMEAALTIAKQYAPLLFAPTQQPKLFEVGTVFPSTGEYVALLMSEPEPSFGHDEVSDNLSVARLEDFGKGYTPRVPKLGAYRPFSNYPFVTRDISMWIPDTPDARGDLLRIFGVHGTALLTQVQLVDQFTNKEGRQSLAFRLIFQAFDRTLTDDEVNGIMETIASAVTAQGFEVR